MIRARRLRRVAATVAVAVAAALTLSGCLYSMIPERPPDPAPVTEGVPGELKRFYDQPPQWSSCGENLQCADITAPLDWNDPGAGEITLAVVRQLATGGPPEGSLLINPGGPGASGVSAVAESVDQLVGTPLQQQYDIVGFDPRGVGDSTAVTCLDDARMDSYLYDIPAAERGSSEWEAELERRNRDFVQACEQNTGELLEFVTTEQAARDLDLLRGVLGEKKLTYLGYSYGTFLGASYAELFPERAGRLVLDGAIDPSVSGGQVGTAQAVGFEQALRSYMEWCGSEGEACAFRGSVDDKLADLGTMLAQLDRSPLRAEDGRMLGADTMMTAIISALYAEANWPYLTEAFAGVQENDPAQAFFLADFYNGREGGTYPDNSTEAFHAYNCMDYPEGTEAESDRQQRRIEQQAPTIAPYWSAPDVCADWPFDPTGKRHKIAADGADPIVVIGTTGDPATPYAWAESLARQLSSGVLVTLEGEGHTAYNGTNGCIDDAVEAYFLEGATPEDGLVCP